MNDDQLRQTAVQRYLEGEKVSSISRSLKKSRKWVHTWINRFREEEGAPFWYKDKSKAPIKTNKATSNETEELILQIRRELEKEKMAQIGAISIQYEFLNRKIEPIPEVWTINRIIARHGLNKKEKVRKSPKDYPELFLHTHQMDLVGPRHIKGDGRYYSINLIDTFTHSCHVQAERTKRSSGIVDAIASFWAVHGLPDALQMDNELAFRGSNQHPHSFGSVIRFALSQGVSPVFIPIGEPWRNGMIEKFNDVYQNKFIRAHTFRDFEDLKNQEKTFIEFHNSRHRYSSQGNKTPDQMKEEWKPSSSYNGTIHTQKRIPLTGGSVYYIRFIRSDRILHIATESFVLPKGMEYSYVEAEINIELQRLIVRRDRKIVETFEYKVPYDG